MMEKQGILLVLLLMINFIFSFEEQGSFEGHLSRHRRSYFPNFEPIGYYDMRYLTPRAYVPRPFFTNQYQRRNTMPMMPYPVESTSFFTEYYPGNPFASYMGYYNKQQPFSSYKKQQHVDLLDKKSRIVQQRPGTKRTQKLAGKTKKNSLDLEAKHTDINKGGIHNKTLEMIEIPFKKRTTTHAAKKTVLSHHNKTLTTGSKRNVKLQKQKPKDQSSSLRGFVIDAKIYHRHREPAPVIGHVRHKINGTSISKSYKAYHNLSSLFFKDRPSILRKNLTSTTKAAVKPSPNHVFHPTNATSKIKNQTDEKHKTLLHNSNDTNSLEIVEDEYGQKTDSFVDYVDDEDDFKPLVKNNTFMPLRRNETSAMKNSSGSYVGRNGVNIEEGELEVEEDEKPLKKNGTAAIMKNETLMMEDYSKHDFHHNQPRNISFEHHENPLIKIYEPSKHIEMLNEEAEREQNSIIDSDTWKSLAEAASLLLHEKENKQKQEKLKMKASLKTNHAKQQELLSKDTTGEDIYTKQGQMNGYVNPNAVIQQHIAHDMLHGDWFDTARRPNDKTMNDLKISSSELQEIANVKMTGKRRPYPQTKTSPESNKEYEKHVKHITDLTESTENEMVARIIKDSLGAAAPSKPLNPLRLKTAEADASKGGKKEETGALRKLLSDDFDVFVDKTSPVSSNEPALYDPSNPSQPVGQVVKSIKTLDDLPEDEGRLYANKNEVTGSKKHLDEDSRFENFEKIYQKWKLFKEANKGLMDETRKDLGESPKIGTNGDEKSQIKDKGEHKNVLNEYFQEVEDKQALDESKNLISRQSKRKEKLTSTLSMISDIENEIDNMVQKELENPPVSRLAKAHRREPTRKGKAKIFKELVDTSNYKEGYRHKPKETAEHEVVVLNTPTRYSEEQAIKSLPPTTGQQSQTYLASPKAATYMVEEKEEPQTYISPQQGEEVRQEEVEEQQMISNPASQVQSATKENVQPPVLQQQVAPRQEPVGTKMVMFDNLGRLNHQEEVEENQLIEHIESSPGLPSEGKTIEKAISATDQNEHARQADYLQNLQQLEMKGDLARLKEATQNGLKDMFNTAVQKQQNFINNIEGNPEEDQQQQLPQQEQQQQQQQQQREQSIQQGQPMQPFVEDPDSQSPPTMLAMPENTESEEQQQQAEPQESSFVAADGDAMFGSPSKLTDNNDDANGDEPPPPFAIARDFLPENGEERKKSRIMEFVASDNDDDDDEDDDDKGENTAMFMAIP